jgi:aminodeoxyfutalosine deaminase
MAFITAERIHNGLHWLPEGSVLEVAEDGTVLNVQSNPSFGVTKYEGILTPGFVNTHCHLELSHLKGAIPEHSGLIPFLQAVPKVRYNFTEEGKKQARHHALTEMLDNGIVAVGDIANTTDTLDLRQLQRMHFATFVEAIGFIPSRAEKCFEAALGNLSAFAVQSKDGAMILNESIVPHAPYSVSMELFDKISAHNENSVISIHNQESEAENQFFTDGTGGCTALLSSLNIDYSSFVPSGRGSLPTFLNWVTATHPLILVHNTYSTVDDVLFAENKFPKLFWCLCPNANLYLENKLPDIDMLSKYARNVCIGTDSLASNHGLSVLAELNVIAKACPEIGWETLLRWGTYNGAQALQMQHRLGSFERGKQPGILQIIGLDNNREPTLQKRLY